MSYFKVILSFLILPLSLGANADADEAYNEFYRALQNSIRVYRTLESVEAISQSGKQLKESWQEAKPEIDEVNPRLSAYLNERVNFIVLATYIVQYDPEWDTDKAVYDEAGIELENSYTDAWKKAYLEATQCTPPSYLKELTDRLRPKHPDAEFNFKDGMCYSTDVLFLADAISLSCLEAIYAMVQEGEKPAVVDVEDWAGLQPKLKISIDDILKPE